VALASVVAVVAVAAVVWAEANADKRPTAQPGVETEPAAPVAAAAPRPLAPMLGAKPGPLAGVLELIGFFWLTDSACAEKVIGAISMCQRSVPLRPSVRPGCRSRELSRSSRLSLRISIATSCRTRSALARVLETKRVRTAAKKAAIAKATNASVSENPDVALGPRRVDHIDHSR